MEATGTSRTCRVSRVASVPARCSERGRAEGGEKSKMVESGDEVMSPSSAGHPGLGRGGPSRPQKVGANVISLYSE